MKFEFLQAARQSVFTQACWFMFGNVALCSHVGMQRVHWNDLVYL